MRNTYWALVARLQRPRAAQLRGPKRQPAPPLGDRSAGECQFWGPERVGVGWLGLVGVGVGVGWGWLWVGLGGLG